MAELDWAEARRYLGLHKPGGTVDEGTEAALEASGALLMDAARPMAVWRRYPLAWGEGSVAFAGIATGSGHLRRHLAGCREAWLFAATLGAETDRLLRRWAVQDVSRAVMVQACAAALLETYCDECCAKLAGEAAGEGLFLLSRFSPGYGDFDISCQRALLEAVEAPKRIGLTATGSMMLSPTKSVTAVIGLTGDGSRCGVRGCGSCGKKDCEFRRT